MRQQSLHYAKDNLSADVFYSKFTKLARERFAIAVNLAAYLVIVLF